MVLAAAGHRGATLIRVYAARSATSRPRVRLSVPFVGGHFRMALTAANRSTG
jgi:hypothetical protein